MVTRPNSNDALVTVRGLQVTLYTQNSIARPVHDVSFSVRAGETLAIVGESGSGKTVSTLSPLGLLPAGVSTDLAGSVQINGKELVGCDENILEDVLGSDVGVIFQDPMSALNPARKIGAQLVEVIERKTERRGVRSRARALELLNLVGIGEAETRLKQYPHELSGGMCQRVMCAIAIAGDPKILIADEPTTALDVTVQAQIMELLKELQASLQIAVILITHDIGVVAGMADYIAVMYAGIIVESGTAEEVLLTPAHPYTRGLLDSISRPEDEVGSRFRGIPGLPPEARMKLAGCPFEPRCSFVIEQCTNWVPSQTPVGKGSSHQTACSVITLGENL